MKQQRMTGREHRQRDVRAHGRRRFDTVLGHRQDLIAHILIRIGKAAVQEIAVFRGKDIWFALLGRQILQLDERTVQPFAIRMLIRHAQLACFIADEPMHGGIDHQQLAGTKPVLADDMLFCDRQHTGLGRQDDMTVVCLPPAQRAQPVAVKRRAQLDAVAEQHRGRAIPWLHQRRVIMIEVLQLARQRGMLPRMRDERGHRLLDRHAVEIQKLQRVIQHG